MVSQLIQTKEQLPTREISDQYELGKVLGQGTYGRVQLAYSKTARDKLALKQLLKSRVAFRDFKRELNQSYFLSAHPSIINTYATAFQTRDYWIFVLEASDHGDLLDAVKPGEGLSVSATKQVIRQVASALSFMHGAKMCHRDVKPENIILFDKENWRVKLSDFGLTCKVDTVVRRKTSDNNPYTPPEICDRIKNEGFTVSTSEDVWQCGITLYCLLTGTYPWELACTRMDKTYANFVKWAQHRRGRAPPNWLDFNGRLIKLFKKLLRHREESRSKIDTIFKHIDYEWSYKRNRLGRPAPADGASESSLYGSDEEYNVKVKQELRDRLEQCGISTVVSRTMRNERVKDWVLKSEVEPDINNNDEEDAPQL